LPVRVLTKSCMASASSGNVNAATKRSSGGSRIIFAHLKSQDRADLIQGRGQMRKKNPLTDGDGTQMRAAY